MNTSFKGRAKRLDDIDLPRIGAQINVGEDELHAIIDVESRGTGFDSQGRPIILFERHWFHRLLPKSRRAAARNQGLATTKWSRASYGKDQYGLLAQAIKIDREAALKSCSWGLFQIMGFNHVKAGYFSVEEMVASFMDDEENHLEAAIEFIIATKLDDNLRNHDWAGFAKGYNGSGYLQNRYDTKLANAYAKWKRIKDTPYSPEPELAPVEHKLTALRDVEIAEFAEDIAADERVSKTKIASAVTGIGGVVATGNQVADLADQTNSIMETVWNIGPWVFILIVILGGWWWVNSERTKKRNRAKNLRRMLG